MATFNSVDTFRDPEKLDIMSTLGTAMSYLQQNYDQNVAETQALINQYVGTDLIRGVDKDYLGDRLQTLVEYINTSGTKNWTKKSVARDIQNYIGTAIDGNVMAAIASTQALRKLDADIEKHKKEGKGYSIQNEWVAKMDLERYVNSNELGDMFRAGTYVPYRDVNDKILKHADTLKNFGAEFVPFSKDAGGGGFFRMIGTREVLSPQKVKSFLGSILDAGDIQQLQIDGMYSLKDKSTEEIKSLYDGMIDNRITALDRAIEGAKLDMTDASDAEKRVLQNNIATWENEKVNELTRKSRKLDRNTMAGTYYQSNFIDGYSNFMSYNRIKDFKIDDSLFKLYQQQVQIDQFNTKHKFEVEKANSENQRWSADYALKQQELELKREKNAIDMLTGGVKKSADGSYVLDPADNPGISTSVDETKPEVLEEENPYSKVYHEANGSWQTAAQAVSDNMADIEAVIKNDNSLKHLVGMKSSSMAGWLVNSPQKSQKLFNVLPPDVQKAITAARTSKAQINHYDQNLIGEGGYMSSIKEIADGLTHKDTKESTKNHARTALGGKVISNDGKIIDGDLTTHTGKYADLTRQIAVLSNEARFAKNDDDRNKILRALSLTLVNSGLSADVRGKLYNTALKGNEIEVFDGKAANAFGKAADSFGKSWRGEGGFLEGLENVAGGIYEATIGTAVNAGEKFGNKAFNVNRSSQDYGDKSFFGVADADIVTTTPISKLQSNMTQQLRAIQDKVNKDIKTVIPKSINIDLDNKHSKDIADKIRLSLPPDINANLAGGHLKIGNYDAEAGTVEISVPVKAGKGEIVMQNVPVAISALPPSIQSSVIFESAKSNPYSAQNPYSVGYSRSMSIPKNIFEAQALKDGMTMEEKLNSPTVPTQNILMQQALAGAPEELVKLHKKEINDMLKSNYQFSLERDNGEWVAVVKRDGSHFYAQRTGQTEYSPAKMRTLADQVIPQAIIDNIRSLVGN